MEPDNDEDLAYIEQARRLYALSDRIDNALSYLDWLASVASEELDAAYIEQLYKILEGKEAEH